MIRVKHFMLVSLIILAISSCNDENAFDKYARPDWLAGKIYSQIEDSVIFETFARCLNLTGYDTIINSSGSYTVFAPNNTAFDLYFQDHPSYNSIEDIPVKELERIVKYHIVQNPWSKIQLMSLDVWGWIDPQDENNDEPRGFKRETLLLNDNIKFGVRIEDGDAMIVDTLESSFHRRIFIDSRKFAPIFFHDYFNLYNLSNEDYAYYFDREFEGDNDLYFVNAKVIGEEIFAENGFVYNIDRVVEPLNNTYEIISTADDDKSYSRFLDLINQFPVFRYNEQETKDQVGADLGFEVDSLFDLTFPQLAYHVTREKTKAPPGSVGLPGNVTIRYHHGMIAPTNEAIEAFENEYLPGGATWIGINGSPTNLKKIITNSHLSVNPIYATDLELGFYNGELDLVGVDPASVVQKQYGSNGTFLGTNKMIVPRAISSITGPIYLRKGFNKVMLAIEESGLLAALKRERDPGEKYIFFVESDNNTSVDSSFLYDIVTKEFFAFQVEGGNATKFTFSKSDIRNLVLNHVGVREISGNANKEFIPNLAGNYIIVNNETGQASGTSITTEGYLGSSLSESKFWVLSDQADNGTTYEIDDWFSFTAASLYIRLSTLFPDFHDLIVDAGLALVNSNKYTFISDSENYTVFAPSAQALLDAQVDTLNQQELEDFIKIHFVRKEMIFTDGYLPSAYYETVRLDPTSGEFNKKYSKIYVDTDLVDQISFRNASGTNYYTFPESDSTNFLAGELLNDGVGSYPAYLNNAVIHRIDKAFSISEMDIEN